MKLYLAAPYAARDSIRELAPMFEGAGHTMTCEWVNGTRPITAGTVGTSPDTSPLDVVKHATMDLEQVAEADALVLFTAAFCQQLDPTLDADSQLHSGGRHIETGHAIALGKDIIVVGPPENIFHRAVCSQVDSIAELLDYLDEQLGGVR